MISLSIGNFVRALFSVDAREIAEGPKSLPEEEDEQKEIDTEVRAESGEAELEAEAPNEDDGDAEVEGETSNFESSTSKLTSVMLGRQLSSETHCCTRDITLLARRCLRPW